MLTIILAIVIVVTGIYVWLFYPQQQIDAKTIQQVFVTTPDVEKYHNDCLHPCIRRMSDGRYVMVQSPWYKCQDGIENPILYISHDPMFWENGIVVADTPERGYNSDPNVFVEGNRIYVFWREVDTPLCEQLGVNCATVGVYTDDEGKTFSYKRVYLTSDNSSVDTEICPILMKNRNSYRFYATWYERDRTYRHNLGIAIWDGTNLDRPDFKLTKTVNFETKKICDKFKQLKVFGLFFFIPKPHKFDLWHFDLFEKNNKLYMVASEERGDVIMLAVSDDWERFQLQRKPLINAHYMETNLGCRQAYYKPTMCSEGDDILLFYTTNDDKVSFHNVLMASVLSIK